MPRRLVKLAKEFNAGTSTLVKILHSKGYTIPHRPIAIVPEEAYEALLEHFKNHDNTESSDAVAQTQDTLAEEVRSGLRMNPEQVSFCQSQEKNIRLLAPAGCGKTFALLERCKHLIEQNNKDKILVFTFTRVARDELLNRINSDSRFEEIAENIRITTINQYGFQYLKQHKKGLSLRTSKSDKYFLIKNILRPIWQESKFLSRVIERQYANVYSEIIEVFDALKSIGFDHDWGKDKNFEDKIEAHRTWLNANGIYPFYSKKIYEFLEERNFLTRKSFEVGEFMDFWVKSTDHLWNSAIISFVDQKYWCHKIILKNYPEGKVIPKPNQYRHIFIDEFQDINPLDLKLIKELVRVNEANLTIVGDDDQAIFEWRGSTPNFIVNPSKFFAGTFEDHLLTRNYRSPKNIVQKSLELIANNKNRVSKSTYPENKNTAIIEVKRFKNQAAYLEDILKFCEQINAQENPETLAILCRKKSQIIPIQILLTARDIPFFAKEDLNVFLSIAFKDLKEILLILSEKNSRRNYKDIIDDIILLINYVPTYPLNKKDAKALRHFLREQRKGFKTTQQALETLFKYDGPKLDKKSKNTGDIILDFYQGISEVFNSQSVSEALTAAGEHFAGLKKHYAKSEEDIYYKDPPFSFLIDYASQYDDNFEDFIDHLEDAIIQMEDQVAEESIDDDIKLPIHIMTALRAKGKEFDNVILLDVIDDIWPSRLSETEMEFEQERRVFYVAVTRAKKALYLYQTENLFGRPVSPSRYISELGL